MSERLRDVLAAHRLHASMNICTGCDWQGAPFARSPRQHAAHLEAVVLAGLSDRLAQAWDEGKHSEHTPECRLGDGDCICRNPYRREGGDER